MKHIGISCGFHDAAMSLIDSNGDILFAAHSERYSKIKHDETLNIDIVDDLLKHVHDEQIRINYYERPVLKYLRQLWAGERPQLSTLSAKNIIGNLTYRAINQHQKTTQYASISTPKIPIITHGHHLSHAAAGFQTSTYDRATVVIIDAIGEWDTATIWAAEYDREQRARYRLLWRQRYPNSVGLFYSAMTQRVGLRPLDEEYILMGMAGWGNDTQSATLEQQMIRNVDDTVFKHNLHRGVGQNFMTHVNDNDIAACAQTVVEKLIVSIMKRARSYNWSTNLVYGGGVALNCLANRLLGKYFDDTWILPNPGDAGSSLGCAALDWGKRVNWTSAYLGHDMGKDYPVERALDVLLTTGVVGVASGRAEFGPRALGNRSLLADPRGHDIKDRVNDIKCRQRFRPFAPVILQEHVDKYFKMPTNWRNSPYMQTVAKCYYPEMFPAIVHVDSTSRVQTVPDDGSGIRLLLEAWHAKTGCPMLLNTSLNVRGEPMVNDRIDADRFQHLYSVPVLT